MSRSGAVRFGSAAAAFVAFLAGSCDQSRQDRSSGARESRNALISDQVHNPASLGSSGCRSSLP